MKFLIALSALATLTAVSSPAFASKELAQKKNCLACHAEKTKAVGPAYLDVANKYKSDKDAVAKLAVKIQKGSTGVWGSIPMPPNAVTEAEAKQLATWVLSIK